MQFLENKYKKWYFEIISKSQLRCNRSLYLKKEAQQLLGYVEDHHIIPRALGGNNLTSNKVWLTAREHFICHLLLVKFTTGAEKQLMQFAVGKFIQNSPMQHRRFTSWEYSKIRESISLARTGKKHSTESRMKMSKSRKGIVPWNKGMTGIVHSDESNKKRSDTLKGKSLEEKVGIERALEIKQRISKAKLGKPSGMLGKTHSAETKKKLSERLITDEYREKLRQSKQGIQFSKEHLTNLSNANKLNGAKRKGIPRPKTKCPHCGKVGGNSLMTRYHFDNCKLNITKK